MMKENKNLWMQTYSGGEMGMMNISDPSPLMIDAEVIAHALSNQCRFGGHCSPNYNVAEHSVHVVSKVSDKAKIYALLHDASEAYLVDIPSSIKKGMKEYEDYQDILTTMIHRYFLLPPPTKAIKEEIHAADMRMRFTEKKYLMKPSNIVWKGQSMYAPYAGLDLSAPWSHEYSKDMFMSVLGNQLQKRSDAETLDCNSIRILMNKATPCCLNCHTYANANSIILTPLGFSATVCCEIAAEYQHWYDNEKKKFSFQTDEQEKK